METTNTRPPLPWPLFDRSANQTRPSIDRSASQKQKRAGLFAILLRLSVASLVIAALLFTSFLNDSQSAPPLASPSRAHAVVVAQAIPAPSSRPRTFHGLTRARDHATLAFPIGGRVVDRPVNLGELVKQGQIIARIDPHPFRNAIDAQSALVAEVDANLEKLKRDHARTQSLVESRAATRAELDLVETSERSLQARLIAATAQLTEARRVSREAVLRAPFDGTIDELAVEAGELVGPGTPVALISGQGAIEVEIEVPESLAGQLSVGDLASIDLPLLKRARLRGTIRSIGGSSGRPGRLFPVIVELIDDASVTSGMTAEVTLREPLDQGLMVPVRAIINPTGRSAALFVAREGLAHRVEVEIIDLVDDHVTVRGPLEPEDQVVVGGQVGLVDEQPLEIRQ